LEQLLLHGASAEEQNPLARQLRIRQYPQPLNIEDDMNLADISKLGVANPFKTRYDNFIGGKFVPPVKGEYFAISRRSPACLSARSHAPPPRMSSWRWTPRTQPRLHGARLRRPSAPIS